jgi:hypothetical protein
MAEEHVVDFSNLVRSDEEGTLAFPRLVRIANGGGYSQK